ncbi:protein of unknown function [Methylorubrum extorquens]|uniref:Uncharacterized protein n=1 Tax=Methylorubrum extorquens TaxID=408 RepID=A0A2N9AT58_METEX|nr:protein of unknown function [Methylorubrum extorquens]
MHGAGFAEFSGLISRENRVGTMSRRGIVPPIAGAFALLRFPHLTVISHASMSMMGSPLSELPKEKKTPGPITEPGVFTRCRHGKDELPFREAG